MAKKHALILKENDLSFRKHYIIYYTGRSISSLGKVPIEILSGKRHITLVLTVSLFLAGFQMEPLAANVIYYDTTQEAVKYKT